MGPSVTLVRTLFQRVAPNPPGPGPGGLPWFSPVLTVLALARTKSAPELLSLMISLTTACLRSCRPMMRASMVLSAEGMVRGRCRGRIRDRGKVARRHEYEQGKEKERCYGQGGDRVRSDNVLNVNCKNRAIEMDDTRSSM